MLTETSLRDELDQYFAGRGEVTQEPYGMYRALRETAPVAEHSAGYVITLHEDVRECYRDAKRFTKSIVDPETGEYRGMWPDPPVPAELEEMYRALDAFEQLFISRIDGPPHARLRRIAQRAFTPRMIEALRDDIQRVTDRLLDRLMQQGGGDFIDSFAFRLPLLAIALMLGVPERDADLIHGWTSAQAAFVSRANVDAIEPWYRAMQEFRAYVHELVNTFRALPPETNLVTSLMNAHNDEVLTEDELVALFVMLLFAGHETTTNLLGNGLHALLRHRSQWELLCDRPEHVASAVEELLRFDSPVQRTSRITLVDCEFQGVKVPAMANVHALIGAANRDPAALRNPDELDITRPDNPHLSFALGPHFCLGSSLTRLEAAIAFEALATRAPELELVTTDVRYNGHTVLRGLTELEVAMGSER
jgi:cytochrome P450